MVEGIVSVFLLDLFYHQLVCEELTSASASFW